jgi:hypothetical protein
MSPASRGRKRKKSKKPASGRPGAARGSIGGARRAGAQPTGLPTGLRAGAQALADSRERPAWFDSSIKNVLSRAGSVMAARGPRELEEATATLLGAELHRVIGAEDHGMWFDWWFGELAEAAAAQARDGARAGGAWQEPWRMLHGLVSIGPPALSSIAKTAIGLASEAVRDAQRDDAARQQPTWLWKLPMIAATGEVWRMRDVCGSRLAMIAGFHYPGGTDPSVFLFDIDACGSIILAAPGAYDDVSQAADAWRAIVGDAASGARPAAVESADDLSWVGYLDHVNEIVIGREPRAVTDNWFRARRRVGDLVNALGKRGMPPPETRSLYHDIDAEPMAEEFTRWHLERHDAAPDEDAVLELAEEWLAGALPGTEFTASPHRVDFKAEIIADWADDEVTLATRALLPEWVRWLGERSGLPEPFAARSMAVAAGESRTASDCPGAWN